jgi:hypothetical protein
LLAVDLNIIVTARAKVEYSNDTSEFMKVIGLKPDGPKEAPHMFDVVLELTKQADNTRVVKVIKDRTNKLPETFEFTYAKLVEYFGQKELEREPVMLKGLQELDRLSNRGTVIIFQDREIKTAGITAVTLTKINDAIIGQDESKIKEKLNEDYSVQSLLDLKEDEAQLFLRDITNTLNQN